MRLRPPIALKVCVEGASWARAVVCQLCDDASLAGSINISQSIHPRLHVFGFSAALGSSIRTFNGNPFIEPRSFSGAEQQPVLDSDEDQVQFKNETSRCGVRKAFLNDFEEGQGRGPGKSEMYVCKHRPLQTPNLPKLKPSLPLPSPCTHPGGDGREDTTPLTSFCFSRRKSLGAYVCIPCSTLRVTALGATCLKSKRRIRTYAGAFNRLLRWMRAEWNWRSLGLWGCGNGFGFGVEGFWRLLRRGLGI